MPLGAGVIAAAAEGIEKVKAKQNGCNEYLQVQASKLRGNYDRIVGELAQQASDITLKNIVETRLQTVYDTLEAVQRHVCKQFMIRWKLYRQI